ncbi:hypothetical protein C2G38_2173357 [Gigaspora rosea]|uniref:Uncharacterized protein n=1 Tax=Gigaspora rosea TaxID=44941 RepID=A0A397VLI2_9GLOM|nr:hypothetical protein C2G38_2173357 [Gigaspora rosea]
MASSQRPIENPMEDIQQTSLTLFDEIHANVKKAIDTPTETLKITARRRDLTFDSNSWNYETIIEAFDSPKKLEQFLSYKLCSIPTRFDIPTAINQKIQYMDTAFFRSFTRDKNAVPAHQKEFDLLFEIALEKFRRHNDVRFVNKVNRQQIYEKLRIKLAVDYLCNLDFLLLRTHCQPRLLPLYRNAKDRATNAGRHFM